jgi:outer membrane protein OmpA-like peptidoglycan-associated protein
MAPRRKLPKQPIDDEKSSKWSIAFLSSVGVGKGKGGLLAQFDLFNRETNRAHVMMFTGGGDSGGLPAEGSFRDSKYVKFTTNRPANFPDFDKKPAKLEVKDRLGRSWRTLKVYNGVFKLMEVDINNWNPTGWHKFEGGGITEIYYSDGEPAGREAPEYSVKVDVPTHEDLDTEFEVVQQDYGLVIRFPSDILFEFDMPKPGVQDGLDYAQSQAISDVMKYLNRLPASYTRIRVEGHTDSKEKTPGYNMGLSKRRAQAVVDYFTKYKSFLDREYVIEPPIGFGATRPVAPNRKPDGSDNEPGRAKNRRVEIHLYRK